MENKLYFRNLYKEKREKLNSTEREKLSSYICEQFLSNFKDKGTCFHVFKKMDKFHEINTDKIIEGLLRSNKNVVLPKMKGKNLLSCKINFNQDYSINRYGVKEPNPCNEVPMDMIDIVILPMLICDVKGYRLGYGGGFYDRFLSSSKALKIGINFFEPVERLPIENYDIPIDYLITPKKLYKF